MTMTFNEMESYMLDIKGKILSNPQEGYLYFTEKWENLSNEDKPVLIDYVIEMCLERIAIKDGFNQSMINKTFSNYEVRLCCTAILKYLNEEAPPRKNLQFQLTGGIKDVDVAKLFYELKANGYLENNNEELAEIIASVFFDVKEKTILSYIKNPGTKFNNAKNLFKLLDDQDLSSPLDQI